MAKVKTFVAKTTNELDNAINSFASKPNIEIITMGNIETYKDDIMCMIMYKIIGRVQPHDTHQQYNPFNPI